MTQLNKNTLKFLAFSYCLMGWQVLTPRELTIQEAILTAKKCRPDLQALDYKIKEEKLKSKEVWGGYLPQLALTASYLQSNSINFSEGFSTVADGMNTGIHAEQLIYQFGGPQQQIKITQASTAIAEADKTTQEAAVAYEVIKTFIDNWVIQQQQSLFAQLEKSSSLLYQKAKREQAAAMLDKQDFLSSLETRTATHEQVATFKEEAALAQSMLTFLLGNQQPINLVDPTAGEITTLIFNPSSYMPPENLEPKMLFTQKGLKKRPELKLIDHKIELENQTAKMERFSNGPRFTLAGDADRDGANLGGQYQASINLSWPIFDGKRAHYRQQQAEARATAAMLQKEKVVMEIKMQIEQAYHNVVKSQIKQQSARIALKRADALFERRHKEFDLGIITKALLEESRSALLQSKNRWLLAQAEAAQNMTLLLYRSGDIT